MARRPRVEPVSLVDAVAVGRLDGLRRLRTLLAESLAVAEPGVTASLARQLRDTMAEIDALERQQPRTGSVLDEIAARRKGRVSGSPARGATAVGGDQRG
jgi:hypothetical protein